MFFVGAEQPIQLVDFVDQLTDMETNQQTYGFQQANQRVWYQNSYKTDFFTKKNWKWWQLDNKETDESG